MTRHIQNVYNEHSNKYSINKNLDILKKKSHIEGLKYYILSVKNT